MAGSHRQELNWQFSVLPRATKKALFFLRKQSWLKATKWYLAGGTALALQMGHRQSVDLDFFIPQKDFSAAKLLANFSKNEWETDIIREGTLYGKLLGAKVSFIAYPFFVPREAPHWFNNVRILDAKDIAVMKIVAVSQRGRKRDFVDLYWYIMHSESLTDVLLKLPEQYPTVAHDYHHLLKALEYFADADADPMPKIFFRMSWRGIKAYFQKEVLRAAKKLLRLE